MLRRFPSDELQFRAEIMARHVKAALETGETTVTLMKWLTISESELGVEEWERTNGITADGTVYSPAAYGGYEGKIMGAAKEEGIKIVFLHDHPYAPTMWLASKNPRRKEFFLLIEKRIPEEAGFHKNRSA
jgi:hypothetical protein